MAALAFKNVLVVDMLVAVLTHMWFRKHEPSIRWALFSVVILSSPAGVLLLPHFPGSSLNACLVALGAFAMTILVSISVYRLSPFHPLAKYPGPVQCKVTKLWGAWIAIGGKPYIYYKNLHDEYGPIVKIGPNELSIIDATMIPNILGATGMPKGPMWGGRRILPSKNFNVNNSLTAVRDLRRHAELRRPWNNAFKPSSVENYEGMVVQRTEQLVEKLKEVSKEESGEPIDLAMWINYCTFDLMGDLAFGGVYSLLRDGDAEGIIPKMQRGISLPSVSQHVPWMLSLLRSLPFIGKDTRALGLFGIEQAKKRVALSGSLLRKDLFHYLLDPLESAGNPSLVLRKSVSSALLAIVAGSDTTASVISNIFYYLLSNPEYYRKLRAEIDGAFPPVDPNAVVDIKSLSALPLLNAVINETLRLQPPIPTSLQRAPALGSGEKALSINMTIPEGTAVQVSPFVIHRSPQYFYPNPEKFWPERWVSQDRDVVTDRTAFIPFSSGPANCPGKPLAIVELRYVTSLLVRTFDMSFRTGYDCAQWEKDLTDRFVLLKGKLPVSLKIRSSEL